MSKPTIEQCAKVVLTLSELIPFFPKEDAAQLLIATEIRCFVGSEERLKWFAGEAARRFTKWDGLPYFRALYATRFTPDDGVAPVVWFPGSTPEECEARYRQTELEENTRRLESYRRLALEAPAEDRAPLLLPEAAAILKPIAKAVAVENKPGASLREREEKLTGEKGPERSFDERRRMELELMEQLHKFNSAGETVQ
jgi:hypothetical protein